MTNFNTMDNYLEHFGKKGMRWGVRSDGRTNYYSRQISKANAKIKAREATGKYNRSIVKQPTAAQLKNRRKNAKTAGGVALLAGTAAAAFILGRQGSRLVVNLADL